MVVSAAIMFTLGLLHLVYTFSGPKLTPRDPSLIAGMSATSLVLTRETTIWKAWVGFNASHSMGAILFGLIYAYLAVVRRDVLFTSPFLIVVGLLMLGGFVVFAKLYWFSIPFWSICVSLACYVASVVASRV
jgi:hypothetical protein